MWRPAAAATLLALASVSACSLEERSDYLIGRSCAVDLVESCDQGQVCLPHEIITQTGELADWRCRDAQSFEPVQGREPPLAYCGGKRAVKCPEGLVCNADRIRAFDGGVRRFVCQRPDNPFAPPLDAG